MNWIKFTTVLVCLLAFSVWASAQEEIPPGFVLAAENRYLELYLNEELAQLIVRHKASGEIWRTNPDVSGHSIASLWRSHMLSQVVVDYTDEKKRTPRRTDNIDQQAIVSYQPIPDGVKITFTMEALGFVIPIEYTLGDNYLEVRIRDSELLETGPYLMTNLWLMPFFGSVPNTAEGYMVLPDGSGAVAYFRQDHPEYNAQFEEVVYGRDTFRLGRFSLGQDVYWRQNYRQVGMPIFGMVTGNKAFLGVITAGDFDATIVGGPSGFIVNFYRTYAQFAVRKQYNAPLSRTRNVPTYESQRIRTDRAVRYYLLVGDEANYVGMANVYRTYLQERFHIAGRMNMKGDVAPLQLRLFMSVIEEGLLIDRLVPMTTFAEAREIVQALMDAGVDHMDITLVGWSEGGLGYKLPHRLPAAKELGGDEGLREFIEWAHEQGFRVFLHDNYVDAYEVNGGFNTRHDVVRTPAGLPLSAGDHFVLSPLVAFERFARRDIPKMAELYGADGLELQHFGSRLMPDRNYNYRLEREDTAFWWLQIAKLAKEEMGYVIIRGMSTWLLAVADKMVDVPIENSTVRFVDHSIPFYQIVISGLVPYSTDPGNLRNDPRREFLKMIEYGAIPTFELTYRDSSLLKETAYSTLFSSEYTKWIDQVVYEYQVACVEMGYLKTMRITEHRQVAQNVFMTGYEDGSRVYVNYRTEPFVTEDGIEIGPLDFVLVRGGEQ